MKRIFLILFLGLGFLECAIAQNTLDYTGLTSSTPAAASYSLRQLSSSYTGYAIQVRRSSDYATIDIGFTASGDLDTVSLKTFISTNNGYVAKWYDQSGNGLNAVQVSQGSQPLIVNAGVIERYNNTPYLTFSGNQWLSIPMGLDRSTYPSATVNMVYQNTSLTGSQALWGCDDGGWDRFQLLNFSISSSIGYGLSNGGSTVANATNNSNRNVYTAIMNNAVSIGSYVVVNGVIGTLFTENGTGSTNNLAIGSISSSGNYGLIGNSSEFLLFTSSLPDADRQTLELNQANYYGIGVPVITAQPSTDSLILCANSSATPLSVSATGSGTLSYQWYSNTVNSNTGGTLISGATSNTYTPATSVSGTLYYYVVVSVSGGFTITSNVSGAIVVDNPPTLNIFPAYPTIHSGDSVSFTASGASSYTWGVDNVTPLDHVSSYKLAVGLRLLISGYTGSAIRLRRSSDNAESDFGFSGTQLDTTSINTFLGAAQGYCTILYDQSGNGNNIVQANASQQPLLVLNGLNGKPTLHFNTSQTMNNPTNFPAPFSVIYTARQTGPSRGRVLQGVSNNWLLGWWNGSYGQAYYNGWVSPYGGNPSNSNPYVYSAEGSGSNSSIYQNDTLLYTNSGGLAGPYGLSLNGGEASDADISEIFVFDTVLNMLDREFVENSSGSYYSIFGPPSIPGAGLTVSPTVTNTYNVIGYSVNGGCADSATTTVTVLNNPNLGAFGNQAKTLFDGSYIIAPPSTSSPGSFTYTSSNTAVATISGSTVNIIATGSTIITSIQAASGIYYSDSISATLTVTSTAVVTANGKVAISGTNYVNKNGARGLGSGITINGENKITLSQGDGLTPATAAASAYAIKQAYPSCSDGYYWIKNANINGGTPFKIYADMTTDGGGWTLIMCNASNTGWTYANAIALNTTSPSINSNYSIIGWADYIKKNASGFQYMIDANARRSNGGIWTANGAYTFLSPNNTQTNITLNTKFGTWTYNDSGIEQIMPWYSNCSGAITTSSSCSGSWWGTLVSLGGFSPAPWIGGGCGVEGCMTDPGIIWYWVR